MSFIKLQSNVAGTGIVTLASLNTNTNSTITLPDQTGTLVASDPAGNVIVTGTLTTAGISNSGNLAFTGTGSRITGDFSNATIASRVMFQTNTTNGITTVETIPNGTGAGSGFAASNSSSDSSNSSFAAMSIPSAGTEVRFSSGIRGTGTYLPMTFYTGGSERMRISSIGYVGIANTAPGNRFCVGDGTNDTRSVFSSNNAFAVGISNSTGFAGWIGGSGTTDVMVFSSSGGAERMRIDANGNVGIGTSSPGSKLEVLGPTRAASTYGVDTFISSSVADTSAYYNSTRLGLKNSNSTSGTFTSIGFLSAATNDYAAIWGSCTTHTSGAAVGYLAFGTNNGAGAATERMRITSTGAISFGSSGTNYGSSGQVLTSQGNSPPTWTTVTSSGGTVTSVGGTGTVNGISLSGTVTTTGSLTLSGSLSGSLSGCTVDGTNSVGYLNIPQNAQLNSYTLVAADSGKHIYHATAAPAATYTIPANSSVAFALGTAISFVNFSNAVLSIACGDTMYLAGTGTTGTRSLAQWGTATAIKVQATGWIISGSALT